jgi:hypothetical protein
MIASVVLRSAHRFTPSALFRDETARNERTGTYVGPNLCSRLRAGDPDALGVLFDSYARAVYNLGFRLTGNWSAAWRVRGLGDDPDVERGIQFIETHSAPPGDLVRQVRSQRRAILKVREIIDVDQRCPGSLSLS